MRTAMLLVVGFVVLATSGCAAKYRVYVNGFLDRDKASEVRPGSCIAVTKTKGAVNPLLEGETKRRIEKLLLSKGYTICPLERADYELSFRYSMDGGRTVLRDRVEHDPGHTVRVHTYEGGDSYSSFYVPGSTRWVTDVETVYGYWFMVEVRDAGKAGGESEEAGPIWVGEVAAGSRVPDLREMIGPMLLGGFEYFGQDTGKRVSITIHRSDPRLLDLLGE